MTLKDIEDVLDSIPYAKILGVKPYATEPHFVFIMPYIETNIGNPVLPALHGGTIGGFMELTAIAQLYLMEPDEKLPKPIGVNIDYLRRGKPEDTYAKAVITKHGSRVANVRVTAWQDDLDAPIAALHGHFMLARAE